MNDIEKRNRELASFFSNSTDLTFNQSLFLAENNFLYWDNLRDQLLQIFVTIKSTKQMLERMGIK